MNMARALDLILERGAIPILNTIPPFKAQLERTREFNEVLRGLSRDRGIRVDLEREILSRRPDDWFGTLMDRIHLTASQKGGSPGTEPTAENLHAAAICCTHLPDGSQDRRGEAARPGLEHATDEC